METNKPVEVICWEMGRGGGGAKGFWNASERRSEKKKKKKKLGLVSLSFNSKALIESLEKFIKQRWSKH